MSEMLTEVRFWAQVTGDARRTIVCSPDLESRVMGWLAARGLRNFHTVLASRLCPDDRVYIVDRQAIEADLNQDIQTYRYHP